MSDKIWSEFCVKKKKTKPKRSEVLEALKLESERELTELIRRRLALPIEKRLNFLRVRISGGGSHL
jgi:hypothetical protein